MPGQGTSSDNTIAKRIRRRFYGLRTEGAGPAREAAAIGMGLFLGCLPFYGFHLAMCWALGTLFRLNRLKVYLAANISNPFFSPFLIFIEIQTGAWVRRGSFQSLSLHAIRTAGVGVVGVDLLLGSLVVGGALAVLAALATYATLRPSAGDTVFVELVRRASDRYVDASITAWEIARGKLHRDPLYRTTLFGRLLPSGGTLIDVGCGRGLMLTLLAEARRTVDEGAWPSSSPVPPRFDRMIGIEIRPGIAKLARHALKGDAEILQADARGLTSGQVRAVLLFDVLHLMEAAEQDAMLAGLAKTLDGEGVILVRDADASAGWSFRAVHLGNRLKALAIGAWRQPLCFRTRAEWLTCFAHHGFEAEVRPMVGGSAFANLLFRLTVKPGASASTRPPGPFA